jgi:hypothetical protein
MQMTRARREEKNVLHHAAHACLCRSCADARGPRACASWRVRVRDASESPSGATEVQRLRALQAVQLYELADARCQDLAAKNSPRWIVRPSDEAALARWTRANRSHLCLARREGRLLPTLASTHLPAQACVGAGAGSAGQLQSHQSPCAFARRPPVVRTRHAVLLKSRAARHGLRAMYHFSSSCACLAHIGVTPPFRGPPRTAAVRAAVRRSLGVHMPAAPRRSFLRQGLARGCARRGGAHVTAARPEVLWSSGTRRVQHFLAPLAARRAGSRRTSGRRKLGDASNTKSGAESGCEVHVARKKADSRVAEDCCWSEAKLARRWLERRARCAAGGGAPRRLPRVRRRCWL